jgi:hypothetical protein
MSHMKAGTTGVGKHIEYITFRLVGIFSNLVNLVFYPGFLPFFFERSEIIFHANVNCG